MFQISDKCETLCEVLIWDGGGMVSRWWRDGKEKVERWRSKSNFRIRDLGFTRI